MVPSCFSDEISWIKVITEIISINYMFTRDWIRKIHPKVKGNVNGNQGCYIYIVTVILNA